MKRKWGKGMEFLKKILTGVLTGAMMCGLMQTVPAGFSTAAVAEAAEFWSSGFGGMMADVSCSDMDFSSYVWKSTVDRCRIYKNETTWNETNINISCVQAKDGSFLTLGRLKSSFGEDIYDARFESDDYKINVI